MNYENLNLVRPVLGLAVLSHDKEALPGAYRRPGKGLKVKEVGHCRVAMRSGG